MYSAVLAHLNDHDTRPWVLTASLGHYVQYCTVLRFVFREPKIMGHNFDTI